ncbi:hypothetical protein [Thermaurantiacus sp.]
MRWAITCLLLLAGCTREEPAPEAAAPPEGSSLERAVEDVEAARREAAQPPPTRERTSAEPGPGR